MYLRCDHDRCMRMDWGTVHGLQCHIVKSHKQPKGTIGSLQKALDRYGVPVSEVEALERQHGQGTASCGPSKIAPSLILKELDDSNLATPMTEPD